MSTQRAALAGVVAATVLAATTAAFVASGDNADRQSRTKARTAPSPVPVVGCQQRSEPAARTAGPRDVVIGPLFMLGIKDAATEPARAFRQRNGRDATWKAPLILEAGRTVTVTVARSAQGTARLVYDADLREIRRVRDGAKALTFRACPADEPALVGSGTVGPTTGWPGGIIVSRAQCVPLEIRVEGKEQPRRVRLPLGTRRC